MISTITDLEPYTTESLFLLMGRNPWPNYIVAKLLLVPGGQLYLVHSSSTKVAADRLAGYWLAEAGSLPPITIPVSEKDGAEIESQICANMAAIKMGRIGLNYTGGTKVMAVHACRAAQALSTSHALPIVLSYLDAQSNCLIFDRSGLPTIGSESLLFRLEPKIEDIVALHAFQLVTDIEREVHEVELAMALLEAHQEDNGVAAWRRWCDEVLRPRTQVRKPGTWDDERLLQHVELTLPADEALRTFVDLFCRRFGLDGYAFSLQRVSQQVGWKKAKHLCQWLDGKWLEYCVLAVLRAIEKEHAEKPLFHDYGLGIKPRLEQQRAEFEVDVGVMQGYQLYAISCTTDADPGLCKLKLFEAYVRAQNMGGDEAFVGLVCTTHYAKKLEEQLRRSWDAAYRIRVFGQSDLQDLQSRLTKWFTARGDERSGG